MARAGRLIPVSTDLSSNRAGVMCALTPGEANYPECTDLDKLYDRILAELQDPFKDCLKMPGRCEGNGLDMSPGLPGHATALCRTARQRAVSLSAFATGARDSWGHSYLTVRGEILGFVSRRTTANAFAKDVFIDQDTVLVLTMNHAN